MKFTIRVENPTEGQVQYAWNAVKEGGRYRGLKGGHISDKRIDMQYEDSYWTFLNTIFQSIGPNSNVQVFRGWK